MEKISLKSLIENCFELFEVRYLPWFFYVSADLS